MNPAQPAATASGPAEVAAQAIIELINSRPRSPRPDEIVAIIKQAGSSAAPAARCPHCSSLDDEYGPITRQP